MKPIAGRRFLGMVLLLTALALACALIHHHADGGSDDCPICRVILSLSAVLFFTAVSLLHHLKLSNDFFREVSFFYGLLLPSIRQNRAPPSPSLP
jgi:hypothetical protein